MTVPARTKPILVGVGASAGGIEAITEILEHLKDENRLAIVLVQHLDADGQSLLLDRVKSKTLQPVVLIEQSRTVEAGTIHVAPHHRSIELQGMRLCPIVDDSPDESRAGKSAGDRDDEPHPTSSSKRNSPKQNSLKSIDRFFHSLAESETVERIGIVLSGAGNDGTLGLKAISDAGGLTFAQDPHSAKYDSMPRNAATTGVADHVLTPARIATELISYADYLEREKGSNRGASILARQVESSIPAIAEQLQKATDHNFQHYKPSTLVRRISRRMQVLKIADVSDYVSRLNQDSEETQQLFRELLIGVTAFFRDEEAFESLATTVIPNLFTRRSSGDQVRIWVPGCARGQEAYSLAMLCCEHLDQNDLSTPVQIFASDIDERALDVARQGAYPLAIEDQLTSERLQRFFIKRGGSYHVSQRLREMVLFSSHNLISDPPFSRQDLISCRNLLIYLGPHLQKN